MKLQAAIDRVSLDRANEIAKGLDGIVDIIELGTSLVKDYGFETLKREFVGLNESTLLFDGKTIDEGEYEFEKGFEANADILTVMAGSSIDTLSKTYEVTEKLNKQMFIDLLEVEDDKIKQIANFKNAIYGLHHSKDNKNAFDAVSSVAAFHKQFPDISNIAVAGGIGVDQAKKLSEQGIANIVIVGGKISGADDPVAAAKQFMEVIK